MCIEQTRQSIGEYRAVQKDLERPILPFEAFETRWRVGLVRFEDEAQNRATFTARPSEELLYTEAGRRTRGDPMPHLLEWLRSEPWSR